MKILGIAGKKNSGKSTLGNFLLGLEMLELGIVEKSIKITDGGLLHISDIRGDTEHEGIFNCYRDSVAMKLFLEEQVHPYIKIYSYADILKQQICMQLLGLEHEQLYDEKRKLEKVNLYWENMPGVYTDEKLKAKLKGTDFIYHEPGQMTAREVLQFVGTEIFRKMVPNVWVRSTVNRIVSENSEFAIVTDVRFPDELQGIKDAGGKVIRLTRGSDAKDQHTSETALDKENFDWSNFDAVLDNEKMTINESCAELSRILKEWEYVEI